MGPGTYRGRCTGAADARWGVNQRGDLQLELVFELLDQPGERIPLLLTFAPGRAGQIAAEALLACGFEGDDPTTRLEGLDDREVVLGVGLELARDGRAYPSVRWVRAAGDPLRRLPLRAPSSEDLAAHRHLVVGALRQARGEVADAPPPPAPRPGPRAKKGGRRAA